MSSDVILQLQASLQKFIDHVDDLQNEKDESGNGLEKQFRELRDLTMKQRDDNLIPATEGRKAHNMKKNRYKDILPFDSTRVTLKEIPEQLGSDYINANFIEGLDSAYNYYIASQGPLPHTVDDFWRMLWEYNVIVIFMACKLTELGKRKCEQYWPDEIGSKKKFGEIEVTLLKEENSSKHSTMRTLEAEYNGETHKLIQLHYTGWPDHDIPEDISTILEMIAEMRRLRKEYHPLASKRPPAVIHCSAGCGRTGTICAIDYAWDILQAGKLTVDFDLYAIIKLMREQRQSMIQTPDQYEMVYVAIQELFKEHLDMIQDHDYGNIKFGGQGESEEEGDVESEPQSPVGEKRRKHSMVPEIQAALLNYGIETENTVPAEQQPEPLLKATKTIFEQPQSPVTTMKEIFELRNEDTKSQIKSSKVHEKYQGNAAELSTHMNSTVEMFERMQFKPPTPTMPSKVKPPQSLQAATGNIEFLKETSQLGPTQTALHINADHGKNESLHPKPIHLEQTALPSCMHKKDFSVTSTEQKKIDGRHVTRIMIGATPTLPPEIKQTPSDAATKSHGRLNSQGSYPYSYASGNEIRTDPTNSAAYSYASVDVDGSQEIVNSVSSAENNIYSSVNKAQNGAQPSSAGGLYTPVHKTSKSKKPLGKGFSEDAPYETVQVGSEEGGEGDEAPSIPERGYIDEPLKPNSNNSTTDNREKSKVIMFKTGNSSSEFGKRSEKKFKGPRSPPAEWNKGKH